MQKHNQWAYLDRVIEAHPHLVRDRDAVAARQEMIRETMAIVRRRRKRAGK